MPPRSGPKPVMASPDTRSADVASGIRLPREIFTAFLDAGAKWSCRSSETIMQQRDKIARLLMEACNERNVYPIAARQLGSQAMGVAHDNSDIDVRAIFASSGWEYADSPLETFDIDDGDIDIHAWNVNKFAAMLKETNPSAVEFLLSDVDYIPDVTNYLDTVEEMMQENATRMALYYHYRSLAKNNYKKYIHTGSDPTQNRAFYVVRGLAYAKHIRETNNIPPLDVWQFMRQSDSDPEDDEYIDFLHFLSGAKRGVSGDLELTDVQHSTLKRLYDDELQREPEPTAERTRRPDSDVITEFLKRAII